MAHLFFRVPGPISSERNVNRPGATACGGSWVGFQESHQPGQERVRRSCPPPRPSLKKGQGPGVPPRTGMGWGGFPRFPWRQYFCTPTRHPSWWTWGPGSTRPPALAAFARMGSPGRLAEHTLLGPHVFCPQTLTPQDLGPVFGCTNPTKGCTRNANSGCRMPRMGPKKKTNLEDPVFLYLGGAREARPTGEPPWQRGKMSCPKNL